MTVKRNKLKMTGKTGYKIEIFTDKEISRFFIGNYDRDKFQFESECNK